MSRKTLVMIGMVVGSVVGGYLPILFGADFLSFSSILGNGIGGLLGIWLAYKITAWMSFSLSATIKLMSNQKGFTPILIVLVVVIISGAIGGFYYLSQTNSSRSNTTQVSTPSLATDETANWKTYTNTKYGYSVEVPSVWVYGFGKGTEEWVIFETSKEELESASEGGIVDIIVSDKMTEPLILGDARNVIINKKTIQIGGIQGEQAEFSERIQTMIPYRGKTYTFNLSKTEQRDIYNQILTTFKFTN